MALAQKQRLPTLAARRDPLALAAHQIAILGRVGVPDFAATVAQGGAAPIQAETPTIFQINVGKLCNQTCQHCHVDAGPDRTEAMNRETFEACLDALARTKIPTVDITGGAPELNPNFRWFVEECQKLGVHVIDRCNLTIIETNAHADLPVFFAKNNVEVVCSLPQYRAYQTDRQRGDGVFEKSIRALRKLNAVGYGKGDPHKKLVLVTNPAGAFLPGCQATLDQEWKAEMSRRHQVVFDQLITITNMPISRYLEWLVATDNLEDYMSELVGAYNLLTVNGLMCRNTISVSWEGQLYDCDFNQMLEIPALSPISHVRDFDLSKLVGRKVATGPHCFGCTAGAGSSCGGSTA